MLAPALVVGFASHPSSSGVSTVLRWPPSPPQAATNSSGHPSALVLLLRLDALSFESQTVMASFPEEELRQLQALLQAQTAGIQSLMDTVNQMSGVVVKKLEAVNERINKMQQDFDRRLFFLLSAEMASCGEYGPGCARISWYSAVERAWSDLLTWLNCMSLILIPTTLSCTCNSCSCGALYPLCPSPTPS